MPSTLYELVVTVSPSLVESATSSLLAAGAAGLEERTLGRRVELVVWDGRRERLAAWARNVRRDLAGARVRTRVRVSELSDWATRWTRKLTRTPLGRRFTVEPLSSERPKRSPAARNRIPIQLVPRLAFGFGDHPSTQLAARTIERWAAQSPGSKLLDVGCGTGILGFVALLSGAAAVLGIDTDRVAVDNARENARLNGLSDRSRFQLRTVARIRGLFDLAVANIDAETLVAIAGELRRLAARVVLTGFLTRDEARVARAYRAQGFAVERAEYEDDWAVLTLAQQHARRRARSGWAGRGKVATTRRARGYHPHDRQ